jgi:Flp pilus assembly protein TadD
MAEEKKLPELRVNGIAGRVAASRRDRKCAVKCAIGDFARLLVVVVCGLFLPLAVVCQDNGSAEKEWFGNGVAISVTVHDDSGAPISSAASVKLLRGTLPVAQANTSQGSAALIVNRLGDFTVIVNAPGFREAQKDIFVNGTGSAQVDVYLRRSADGDKTIGVGARPILAPKAQEALKKGLEALSTDKTGEAEKQIALAMKLAPGNPDVLYAEGVLLIKARKWAEAQSMLEKATQIDPSHARAFSALGMALFDQGKYEAATGPLEKSLQLDSAGNSPIAWESQWALAKVQYKRGEYSESARLSQSALTGSHGKEPTIALLLAQSLTALAQYDEAARVLNELLRTSGETKEAATARRWLESLARDGKIQTAKN